MVSSTRSASFAFNFTFCSNGIEMGLQLIIPYSDNFHIEWKIYIRCLKSTCDKILTYFVWPNSRCLLQAIQSFPQPIDQIRMCLVHITGGCSMYTSSCKSPWRKIKTNLLLLPWQKLILQSSFSQLDYRSFHSLCHKFGHNLWQPILLCICS
jgi:hypothetical protein